MAPVEKEKKTRLTSSKISIKLPITMCCLLKNILEFTKNNL